MEDLCKMMDQMTNTRLNLDVDGNSLMLVTTEELRMAGLENAESVSLAEGLFSNELELDISAKTCLALVLSYALLDFCWKPWFPVGWTNKGISLLQYNALLLRPTLMTCITRSTHAASQPEISGDLKLLFHGVLLLEIFKQGVLSFAISSEQDIDIDDIRIRARKEFDMAKWGDSEGFRQSAEACIDGFQTQRHEVSGDAEPMIPVDYAENFAAEFCRAIITPLERDFVILWGDRDPDQVLSELKLPSIKKRKLPVPPNPNTQPRRRPPLCPPKPDHLRFTRAPTWRSRDIPQMRFFDAEETQDPTKYAPFKLNIGECDTKV